MIPWANFEKNANLKGRVAYQRGSVELGLGPQRRTRGVEFGAIPDTVEVVAAEPGVVQRDIQLPAVQ